MDFMGILKIAGVIISLLFGVLGIYFSVRKRQYPGEITFVKESLVSLFDELVENIENLQVLYKSNPIQKNIVLMKGHLLNTGSIDISQEKVNKELTATLPNEYKWLETKIISSSPGLDAHITISKENELCFDLGLFRRDETISFQALAQIPSTQTGKEMRDTFDKELKWHHRIADTNNNIQKASYNPNPRYKRLIGFASILSVFMMVFPLIFLIPQLRGVSINYEITTKDDQKILVRLIPRLNDKSKIVGVNNDYSEEIDFDKFFSEYSPKPVLRTNDLKDPSTLAISAVFPLYGIILLIITYLPYRSNKNIEKILNKTRNAQSSA